jgi:eukaryotic-like serine/threonine-protein kinase
MSRSTTEHRLLLKRYRIEEFLGQGGMAQVHRGTDLVLDRTVAVKILTSNLARDPKAVRRFRREAQAAAGLGHPGIVAVYDTGSDGDVHFIVMELISGRTLADILDEDGSLSPERAIDVSSSVASALAHAHGKGIVHRDVKPGNIMITTSGEVKVMDFGIARTVSAGTFTNTASVLGTATYFAPEQARGGPVDERTDLYALGVVLYEMLAGRPPFAGDSPVAVAYQHVREQPTPPSRLNPRISPALEAVVLRAMAKDPGARQQTASELARDLQRVRTGATTPAIAPVSADRATQPVAVQGTAVLPPIAPPPGARLEGPPSHRRPARRHRWGPWLVGFGALLVVALIGTLILAGLSRRPAEEVGPRSRPTTQSPPPSPSPTASPRLVEGPLSVQAALNQLALILNQGFDNDEISRSAANEIAREIEGALKDYQRGDLEPALGKLDKLQGKVQELESKGEIESPLASRLGEAISDLGAAMEANPPSPRSDEEEDEGDE